MNIDQAIWASQHDWFVDANCEDKSGLGSWHVIVNHDDGHTTCWRMFDCMLTTLWNDGLEIRRFPEDWVGARNLDEETHEQASVTSLSGKLIAYLEIMGLNLPEPTYCDD